MSETNAAETASAVPDFERETQRLPDELSSDPKTFRLFYEPPGTLRLTVADDHSYTTVKLFQASPLSLPGRYLSLQSGRNEEIALVPDLDALLPESRATAEEELRRRYLTSRVQKVNQVRTEFGITYWQVDTDRGPRDFVVQSMSESCLWLSDDHILLTDVDGNRFEIASRAALDTASNENLEKVL